MCENKIEWIHRGFEEFSRGSFEAGGSNLYVNAKGIIETIHRFDVNNDGYVDIILPNSHGYIERGPTWIYGQNGRDGSNWTKKELPNDSGWMSRVADVDGDGYPDLIVVNGENGVTSELDSYIYWGGPGGLTGERTILPTAGAYDVAVADINGDGRSDLIMTSAWVDHHNPGRPRYLHVFIQTGPRRFEDASEQYRLTCVASTSLACADLTGNGKPDLVVANYRSEFEYDTDSFVYWGSDNGFDADNFLRLPSHFAMQVITGDLNHDGFKEIVFCGGDQVWIYWNDHGKFDVENRTLLNVKGMDTLFCQGAVHADIADVDGDGGNELILATKEGVEIRGIWDEARFKGLESNRDMEFSRSIWENSLSRVKTFIEIKYAGWVYAADLNCDGYPELIVSRFQNGVTYETESAVYWNSINGISGDHVTWLSTAGATGCTAGDLDGDGLPEVIFNNTLQGYSQFYPGFPVYVYLGGDDYKYGVHRRLELPTGGGSNSYSLADLDLDGYPDLVITTIEGLRIFPGGPGGPAPDKYYDLPRGIGGTSASQVLVADLNRDGWLDIIMGGYTYDDKPETLAGSSFIFYGSPDGYSKENSECIETYCMATVHLADINNDGWLELIYGDKRGYIAIYLGGPGGYSKDRMLKIPMPGNEEWIAEINSADLDNDGWLELIVSIPGHYFRKPCGFYIFHGGPEGFSSEKYTYIDTKATAGNIVVSDVNNNGKLDLLVAGYSTQFTRILPARIFWGNANGFDFNNPTAIECAASVSFMCIDLNDDGYKDIVVACHRDDLGHQVDSLIFWNGSGGLSPDRVTRIPGLGPHGVSCRDFGNAYTREPVECYISPPYCLEGRKAVKISWQAVVPQKTYLKFQLRWAQTVDELKSSKWFGPDGEGSFYETPGQDITGIMNSAEWLQYKAVFASLNGCLSPELSEVSIIFDNTGCLEK